ncbi:MAG: HlyC/CorC family transporter [Clostridia bacterium]|nr:HlyC/CorC family transporter [Clostridia bacterium]MBQ1934788.1 HlyC/CorC family transporter [Clostridia bacterium]MBR0327319.1 HlyC/CorC family transporter [Clostridia bacterium]
MPDGSSTKIIIMLICLAFSAFFSATETAFTSANQTKLKNMASEGNRRAARVLRMSENYDKLLSAILVGNNVVNILLSSTATLWFVDLLVNTSYASAASAISTAVITIIVLLFGEISPKSLAKEKPEKFAMAVAPLLAFIILILTPINFIFILWKKLLNLVFKPGEEDTVTEGEVLTLIDEAHEDGSIDEYNKELIENIFDFDDLTAAEIATHRTDLTTLAKDGTDEEWEDVIQHNRFSRIPVYGEDVDDIIGVLDTREYFRMEDKSREKVLENALRPAYFVPESVKADVLFRNMKKNKESMAIVLDEYGGVFGVITFTDLVQCLVGDFSEDEDEGEALDSIVMLEENVYQLNCPVPVSEVEETLGIKLEDCDSDTFGGFVLGLYGSIPDDDTTFELETDDLFIKVLSIKDHRIEAMTVTLKKKAEEDPEKETFPGL